jgi:hypothetical protein
MSRCVRIEEPSAVLPLPSASPITNSTDFNLFQPLSKDFKGFQRISKDFKPKNKPHFYEDHPSVRRTGSRTRIPQPGERGIR